MQNKSLKCAACGTPYTQDMKFCASCGARLSAPAVEAAPDTETLYACPGCGEQAKYGIQFCTRCGSPFDWQNIQKTSGQALQESQSGAEPPPSQYQGNHISSKTHSWFVPFMAVLGVIVVAGIIALIVFSDAAGELLRSFSESPVTTLPYTATPTSASPVTTPLPPATTATTPTPDRQILIYYSGSVWPEIGGHIYPESGNTFLVLDLNIRNQGYDTFNVVPLNFEVTVNKTKYNADISSSSDIAGVLQPLLLKDGMATAGKLAFEVLSTSFISEFKIGYSAATGYNIVWIRN